MSDWKAVQALVFLTLVFASVPAGAISPGFAKVLTVAADGSGEFTTIQSAIDTIPRSNRNRILIEIRDGIYPEKVLILQDRITLRGQSRKGTQLKFYAPREEYDRRYDAIGPGVMNVFGDDTIIERMTIENTQPNETHAFAVYGQPNRLILDDCEVLGSGGDTLSLWNTPHGMYYHRNCHFKGGVDFVCPRGWCFIRDSQFEAVGRSAMLWHDGHMDLCMKFVVRDCAFDGPENFWLGRNHYPSQFYLLNARFSSRMADKPIQTTDKRSSIADPPLFERKYFWNCHREGGDYPWFGNNLDQAPDSSRPEQITPKWTFGGRWDPESTAPPQIMAVEVDRNRVFVQFDECVAGAASSSVSRADGSTAKYVEGDGSSRLVFAGGNADSTPDRLKHGDSMCGTLATLAPRLVTASRLPVATKRSEITILLVGDSTVATYKPNDERQGWGGELSRCFDDRVHIINRARNGRSSKSFSAEGLWDKAMMEKADYVLIQFGHNDNAGKGPERETNPAPSGDFRKNLRQYIDDARRKGEKPILVTPTSRRVYAKNGLIDRNDANTPYAEATRAVAKEMSVPLLDLNQHTRDLFDRMGEAPSNWMQPEGDRTHFTRRGARRIAAMATEEIQQAVPALKPFVVQDSLVHD
jgi:lysophospholipase L1-like esterase